MPLLALQRREEDEDEEAAKEGWQRLLEPPNATITASLRNPKNLVPEPFVLPPPCCYETHQLVSMPASQSTSTLVGLSWTTSLSLSLSLWFSQSSTLPHTTLPPTFDTPSLLFVASGRAEAPPAPPTPSLPAKQPP